MMVGNEAQDHRDYRWWATGQNVDVGGKAAWLSGCSGRPRS